MLTPEQDPNTQAAMPATPQQIHAASARVRGLRDKGLTWRQVSEETGYSRVQALQLVHNMFGLIDAATAARRAEEPASVWHDRRSA